MPLGDYPLIHGAVSSDRQSRSVRATTGGDFPAGLLRQVTRSTRSMVTTSPGCLDFGLLDLVSGGVPLDGPQAQVVAHRDDNGLSCADADHVVLWLRFARLCAHALHRRARCRLPAGASARKDDRSCRRSFAARSRVFVQASGRAVSRVHAANRNPKPAAQELWYSLHGPPRQRRPRPCHAAIFTDQDDHLQRAVMPLPVRNRQPNDPTDDPDDRLGQRLFDFTTGGSGVEVLAEPSEQVSDRFRVVFGVGHSCQDS